LIICSIAAGAFASGPAEPIRTPLKGAIEFAVYPNPSNGILNLEISHAGSSTVEVKVLNLIGQTLRTSQFRTGEAQVLDLTQLPKGVYFIQVSDGSETANRRIILQ
jgi:hypothetical protein